MAGPDVVMFIDLENPDRSDLAHTRELLQRVGYNTKGMSDDEALDLVRRLMAGARQPDNDSRRARVAQTSDPGGPRREMIGEDPPDDEHDRPLRADHLGSARPLGADAPVSFATARSCGPSTIPSATSPRRGRRRPL